MHGALGNPLGKITFPGGIKNVRWSLCGWRMKLGRVGRHDEKEKLVSDLSSFFFKPCEILLEVFLVKNDEKSQNHGKSHRQADAKLKRKILTLFLFLSYDGQRCPG